MVPNVLQSDTARLLYRGHLLGKGNRGFLLVFKSSAGRSSLCNRVCIEKPTQLSKVQRSICCASDTQDSLDLLDGEDSSLDAPVLDSEMGSLDEEEAALFEADQLVLEEGSKPEEHALSPSISVDRTAWGPKALKAARKVIASSEFEGLALYSFQAKAKSMGLDIRLDKLQDKYGSPSMDEVADFARSFYRELEAVLGEEEAGAITVEVSSAGADRQLQIPGDLKRFRELPMSVTYSFPGDASKTSNRILQIEEMLDEQGKILWRLADVRANRPGGKGTKLTRKQAAERFDIPVDSLQNVKIYVDF